MKKNIVVLMCTLSFYASDQHIHTPKKITPADFTEAGKKHLSDSIAIWVRVGLENNIPMDQGLAKLFMEMYLKGVEEMIENTRALEIANEYYAEFLASPSACIAQSFEALKPDGKGNYSWPSAKGVPLSLRSVVVQYELCNSQNKKNALWKLPDNLNFVPACFAQSAEKAKEILPLNKDYDEKLVDELWGQGLLSTYYWQQAQQ